MTSPKKLTFFVEGLTEKIFIEHLISEYATKNTLDIRTAEFYGGGEAGKRILIKKLNPILSQNPKYIVQIFSSNADNRVIGDVKDRLENLKKSGHDTVIAIRDIFPAPTTTIPNLQRIFSVVTANKGSVKTELIIPVRETESWFLAEGTHFQRLHAGLSDQLIINKLPNSSCKTNFLNQRYSDIIHPSKFLGQIYNLKKGHYKKTKSKINKVVKSLDFNYFYINSMGVVPELVVLRNLLDNFFT